MTATTLSPKSAKVKFRLAGGAQPLILLPVQVNGDGPFKFILDTGAGTSLLSSDLAKKLNLKIISTKEGQSAGGKISVSLAKVDSLALGQAKLDDLDVGIVDLSHIGKAIGTRIDGDVGYNFLKHFRIAIDYHDCEIRFDEPRRIERLGRSAKAEIPMRLASLAKPTTAIAPELAQQLGLKASPVGPLTTGDAQVNVTAGTLESFQVGRAGIDDLVVVVADFFSILSQAVGVRLDGIVGYNFLRNFRVVIDYPGEKLRLE